MLTQERLKELLHYNPDTGIFTWIDLKTKRRKLNPVAGFSDKGYIRIDIGKDKYRAHRLAWLYVYGEWPKKDIDHINHIRSDNRIENLRDVTAQQNHNNRSATKRSKSGVNGVSFEGKWRARIYVDKKQVNLGVFYDLFEAICVRKSAENRYGYHKNHGL